MVLETVGGIGGLLAMQDSDNDGDPNDPNDFELNYVYAYDGNGNVGQLVAREPGYGSTGGYMWDTTRCATAVSAVSSASAFGARTCGTPRIG